MTSDQQRRQHVHDARDHATKALSALHRLLPPTNTLRRLQPQGDPGCASCRRNNQFSPQAPHGQGHCDWCYRWKNANGTLPPLGVLEARAQGRRITTRVVDEATRAERRPTRKPKRRKAS